MRPRLAAFFLLAACGASPANVSVCDAYLACLQSIPAEQSAYASTKAELTACDSSGAARTACNSSCAAGMQELMAAGYSCSTSQSAPHDAATSHHDASTNDDASTLSDASVPHDAATTHKDAAPHSDSAVSSGTCLQTTLCANDSDCTKGERCNTELNPPRCQTLYCGENGSVCGGSDPSSLCASRLCSSGVCGVSSTPDLTVVGTSTCAQVITCTNACTTEDCYNNCVTAGTPMAQSLFMSLITCVDTACPFSPAVDAGTSVPCAVNAQGDVVDVAACDTCQEHTQNTGGACVAPFDNCTADQT